MPSDHGRRGAGADAPERRRIVTAPVRMWLLATLALAALVPDPGAAQSRPGQLPTRASCERALADWTLGRRSDASPFHVRPALSALLPPGGAGESRSPGESRGAAETAAGNPGRSELALAGRVERGILRAAETVPSEEGFRYPGPTVEPRREEAAASLFLHRRLGRIALVGDATLTDRLDVPVAQAALRLGEVVLSAGRQAPWPGHACTSGLVLAGRGRADGVGVDTPWLDVPLLGTPSISAFLGTLHEASSDNDRPFFLVQRAIWPVRDDLRLGLTRAAVFGGRSSPVPVTLRSVGLMLLGITDVEGKDSDFENQVASLDLSWRVPAGSSAVRLRLEYAADDFGRAFFRAPALSAGAAVVSPAGDGFRTLDATLTWIAPSTAGHPEWYRHGALAWGWTDRGVLLGHDLAGEGWGLRLGGFLADSTREVGVRLLVSRRGDENLYAPEGRGWGLQLRSEGRAALGSWAGGRFLAGWHLEAGRLSRHDLLRAGASVIYGF